MKYLFPLFLLFITLVSVGNAQDVPEKSNAIVLTQADSVGLREKVLKVLSDKDYVVNSGKTAPIITTTAKTLKNGARVHFSVQIKGKEIILTGKLPVAGQSTMTIAYQGKKGTPIMNGWEEMEKIAKALGGKITYTIK